ncbi:MAG: hypothetical protein H6736_16595 [Alphaproteobacteria bacterium]|nr:hypothetical protein [Alphaproteobacteria bacterium]MCB9693434.1 hypothetical protein [Alphaproteobacteria bacterium]
MIALALLACTPEPAVVQPDPVTPVLRPEPPAPPDMGLDTVGTVETPDAASPTREVRRMDIDQLDASIRSATGGIGWDVDGVSQLQELSASLGVPDFAQRTSEDLTAGLLFQKFLDDAANAVCDTLVERELAGTSNVLLGAAGPTDTRATNAAAVDAALAAALLRYHGRRVSPGDPQLDPWTLLFDSTLTVTGGDTMAAWRSVCIGLIVHPDFYQY